MSGFATARQKMLDGQVRTNDVTDARILDAMLVLPREVFVPESRRALAYLDLDLDGDRFSLICSRFESILFCRLDTIQIEAPCSRTKLRRYGAFNRSRYPHVLRCAGYINNH